MSGLVGWIQGALQAKSGNHTLIHVWFGGVDSRGSTSKVREPYTHTCLVWWGGFKRLYKQSQGTIHSYMSGLVGWIQEALQAKSGNHTLIHVWFDGVGSRGSTSKFG